MAAWAGNSWCICPSGIRARGSGHESFAILFGARHSAATEHQEGLMLAIAVEIRGEAGRVPGGRHYITFGMMGGVGPLITQVSRDPVVEALFTRGLHGGTLVTVTLLSFVCIFLLPRRISCGSGREQFRERG